MSIQINYKSNSSKKNSNNLILFVNEKFSLDPLKKHISSAEFSYIKDLLKTSDLSKNLLIFELNSKKKIVIISVKKNLTNFDVENLGAELFVRINYGKNTNYSIKHHLII